MLFQFSKKVTESYRKSWTPFVPMVGKVFEIVTKKLYFETNDLFNPDHMVLESATMKCAFIVAFHFVSHNLLLRKLTEYGVRGVGLSLPSSYLHNRK